MSQSETIIFNGVKFRRYPESKLRQHRCYFYPSGNYQKRGIGALHIEIWKSVHGEVPKGKDIHHEDGDTLNNDISNLECLTRGEHIREHFTDPKRLEQARKHIENIRPFAILWHKSPEGREWHREHAKNSIGNMPIRKLICDQCSSVFKTIKPTDARFCSNKCKSKWRRDSGIDNVERSCKRCLKFFTINKYEGKTFCSHVCAGKMTGYFGSERIK